MLPRPEPFNPDAGLPRAGLTDKVLLRGLAPCEVTFVNPIKVNGEVVRIEMKAVG